MVALVTEINGTGGEITAERSNIKIIILARIIDGVVENMILIIMAKGTMNSIEIIIVQNIINSSDGDILIQTCQMSVGHGDGANRYQIILQKVHNMMYTEIIMGSRSNNALSKGLNQLIIDQVVQVVIVPDLYFQRLPHRHGVTIIPIKE